MIRSSTTFFSISIFRTTLHCYGDALASLSSRLMASIVALAVALIAQADPVAPPHVPHGANLLDLQCANFGTPQDGNGEFDGIAGWTIDNTDIDPLYDASVSRTSGSGSIRFPAASGLTPDIAATETSPFIAGTYSGRVRSCMISSANFEYDKPYTVSFYVHSTALPAYVSVVLHFYSSTGVLLEYTAKKLAVAATTTVTSTQDWQEASAQFTITNHDAAKIQILFDAVYTGPTRPDIYVDDVYFGEGISFAESAPSSRPIFNGVTVKVDALGNWQTHDTATGTWKDFFPFGLYPDLTRDNYVSLANQGFNLVMSQQYTSQIQKAKDVGIRAGLRLAKYAVPGDPYWTLTRLGDTIGAISAAGQSDTLLMYDWDNENNWMTWNHWQDMVDTIRTGDTDQDGVADHDADNDHPIYILNGYPAVQPRFTDWSDVVGTYVDFNRTRDGGGGLEVLQNLERQSTPVSIAQLNQVEEQSYAFRLRVYDALIRGARGIVYWGDDDDKIPALIRRIENRPWWSDVATLRTEIDRLQPILKQPHWTNWSATSSDTNILFGTRDYGGEGYLIVANPQASSATVTFTLNGLFALEVWDYFDQAFVAPIVGGQFAVALPAHGTAVYRLSYHEALANGGLDIAASPLLADWIGSGSGYGLDTTVKYAGSYAARIVNDNLSDDRAFLQYFSALKPNTTYRFSAMIKTDNITKATSDIYTGAVIQLYVGGFKNEFLPNPGLSGTHDWQQVQYTFTTPATFPNSTWYVRLRLREATGTVWFDNPSLREIP